MGGLQSIFDNVCSVVGNVGIIRCWAGRPWERGVPVGDVCQCLLDETYKVVCVSTDGDKVRILYVMEYRHECLTNL